AEAVHRIEALAAGLEQDADQIDDHVAAANGSRDRGPVADVGLDRVNLADAAERLEMTGQIWPADRNADARALPPERLHDMAAEKSRSAEDRDQHVPIGLRHRRLPCPFGAHVPRMA